MSFTPSGAVRVSYWTYTAAVMNERFREAIKRGSLKITDFPINVWRGAVEFLSSALEASDDRVPKNPCADIANYIYACDALEIYNVLPDFREKIKDILQRFFEFLVALPRQSLSGNDPKLIEEMAVFFENLRNKGADEHYDEVCGFTDDDD